MKGAEKWTGTEEPENETGSVLSRVVDGRFT